MAEPFVQPPGGVRLARPSDVPYLAAIEVEAFSDPWPGSAFHDVLRMPSARVTVVADDGGVPLAYCVLITAADQGEVANLAVAGQARRRGLGDLLLQDALAYAASRQVAALFLEVRQSNVEAQALYRKHKFQVVGRRRGYYQRPSEDALVLQWTGSTGNKAVL